MQYDALLFLRRNLSLTGSSATNCNTFLRIAVASLAFFLSASSVPAQITVPENFSEDEDQSESPFQEELAHWHRDVLDLVMRKEGTGIVFSSAAVPRTGKLVRQKRQGGALISQWCSATLLDHSTAITAAHCICDTGDALLGGNPKSFAECNINKNFDNFIYTLVLPALGVAPISWAKVHEKYIRPDSDVIETTKSAPVYIADIALIYLETPIPITPIEVASFHEDAHYLTASFGRFATSESPEWEDYNIPPNSEFSPGLGTLQIFHGDQLYAPGIVAEGAMDAIGALYTPRYSSANNNLNDATACAGDSGAPLLQLSDDGRMSLVGVLSYVDPPGYNCNTRDRASFYIDIGLYLDWINNAYLEKNYTGEFIHTIYCGESTFSLTDETNRVLKYVNVYGNLHIQSSGGPARPKMQINSREFGCVDMSADGMIHCYSEHPSDVDVSMSGPGIVQFSVCHR